jgi:adenylate cyclase
MPLVAPFGAMSLSAFGMILKNYLTEGKKRREIKGAFKQYLSPHVVSEISKDPDSLKLGGEEKNVTLFFSDIANFTNISEFTTPTELVGELNTYFSMATKIIQDHFGTLDKYIGDAIMAFWGAPLEMDDHAYNAVLSALSIQEKLNKGSRFKTRIGIHTGPAVVGNIGSDIRFNYTAIGDTVNLASRLESLNKQLGTKTILSESTFSLCSGKIQARRIGRVRVKGRKAPVNIFEPLGKTGDYGRLGFEACEKFASGLALFEGGDFKGAAAIFAQTATGDEDPCAEVYAGVCRAYTKQPPDDFDGVITFNTK